MDLQSLALFVDVARRGSFAAAARERDLDASSVSRVIAVLEAELGLRLFQRTTRRMALTEAGDVYLARVEPLVEELRRAQAEAQSVSAAPSGTLRLTASVTFGIRRITPLIGRFREAYPEVRLDCLFTDSNVDLVAERVDLAIRLAPAVEGDVIASKLMETRYKVVASPAYLDAGPALEQPGDLTRHRCLMFTLRPYRTRWLFRDRQGTQSEVRIEGDLTMSTPIGLLDAALAGLGPALLPDWLVDEHLAAGRLVEPLREHRATATTFDTAAWLIYPSRAFLPSKVRAAIDFFRREFGHPT